MPWDVEIPGAPQGFSQKRPQHWNAGLRHGTFDDCRGTMPCRRPALQFMESLHAKFASHWLGPGTYRDKFMSHL